MKKFLTLIAIVCIAANLNAQSTDMSNHAYIKKTIPFNHSLRANRSGTPDTTGLVNFTDFQPEFASTSGGFSLYGYTGGGFIFGNNVAGENVCAQGYANINNTPIRILGVLLYFGAKQSDAGSASSSKVMVKAWGVSSNKAYNTDNSGTFNSTIANSPGPSTSNNAPDASADILFTNIDTTAFTYVSFVNPPVYSGDFAVGVDFASLAVGDTLGLLSDTQNDARNLDYAFHIYQNKWFVTDQLFSNAGAPDLGSGGLDNDVAIWAVIEPAQCDAHYTTTYDSVLNTFNLDVDALTTSFSTSYHWDFGDGSTSTLAAPTHVYTVDTLYNVCLKTYIATGDSCEYCHIIGTDASGNIVRTGGFVLNVINHTTVSVNDTPNENTITISPNPFTAQTTISFSTEQTKTNIILTDILGKEILTTSFSGKQFTIEKGNLKPGIYFVKVSPSAGNSITKKLIIQ